MEVEGKLHPVNGKAPEKPRQLDSPIALDFGAIISEDPTLITTSATIKPETDGSGAEARKRRQRGACKVSHSAPARAGGGGEDLPRSRDEDQQGRGARHAGDLADRRGGAVWDDQPGQSLCGILDRSKFAYIPLDCYEVDRQVVKMLPEEITLARLIVPFDLISRTIMIATANPFDAQGKEAVQQLLDYNIQWHVADPGAIAKVLKEATAWMDVNNPNLCPMSIKSFGERIADVLIEDGLSCRASSTRRRKSRKSRAGGC